MLRSVLNIISTVYMIFLGKRNKLKMNRNKKNVQLL